MEPNTASARDVRNRKIFLLGAVVVVIIVLLLLGAFLLNKRKGSPAQAPAPKSTQLPKEVEVALTSNGFEPKEVTISVGSAVRWSNNTSDPRVSVNSDDYPNNRKYPELNLGELPKGSTLVHIFNKPGTYTYHDQFHPDRKGTVIVK